MTGAARQKQKRIPQHNSRQELLPGPFRKTPWQGITWNCSVASPLPAARTRRHPPGALLCPVADPAASSIRPRNRAVSVAEDTDSPPRPAVNPLCPVARRSAARFRCTGLPPPSSRITPTRRRSSADKAQCFWVVTSASWRWIRTVRAMWARRGGSASGLLCRNRVVPVPVVGRIAADDARHGPGCRRLRGGCSGR